jgi:hypothetical protein
MEMGCLAFEAEYSIVDRSESTDRTEAELVGFGQFQLSGHQYGMQIFELKDARIFDMLDWRIMQSRGLAP